jgi:hypothetical protein
MGYARTTSSRAACAGPGSAFDRYADKDYSHRKVWVLERLKELSAVFAIDVCAYAVMTAYAEHPSLLNG